jgi:hypothetical protein
MDDDGGGDNKDDANALDDAWSYNNDYGIRMFMT